MNKTANCIKMLSLLYGTTKISIQELASILETNPRNIIEYKKELENAGYVINSYTGKYGGYSLSKKNLLPQIKLSKEEKITIFNAFEFLRKDNCFLKSDCFETAVGKLCSSFIDINNENFYIDIYQRFPLRPTKKDISKYTSILKYAIINKNRVQISYLSKTNKESTHIIEPYKIYLYSDSWFVLANNPSIKKVLYYKISRINTIKNLNEKFRIPYNFNIKDYLDDFGMLKNGDWIHIKFLLRNNAYIMAKERIYAKNQILTEINDSSCYLEGEMQDKELLSFILGWGTNCKVIEPSFLQEQVKNEISQLFSIYNC